MQTFITFVERSPNHRLDCNEAAVKAENHCHSQHYYSDRRCSALSPFTERLIFFLINIKYPLIGQGHEDVNAPPLPLDLYLPLK